MMYYLNRITHKVLIAITILISVIGYYFFAYKLVRGDFWCLIGVFSLLFFGFIILYKNLYNWKTLIALTILFRCIFLIATPNLSQDFYRFIWDGRMLLNEYNPYLYLPQDYLSGSYIPPVQANKLVKGMQELNASHYSNYPPLNQLSFFIATLCSGESVLGSIIVMRLQLIVADIGILYFGKKLLTGLQLNPKLIFLYLLNPFIVVELIGNLHFEGIMIFFLIWALYLFRKGNWKLAAVIFACSISVKLLPLMFLPLFFKRLRPINLMGFYSVIGVTTVLMFLPFFSEDLINNYSRSVGLWFGQFEFNGGFHTLVKIVGKQFDLNNITKALGKITPVMVLLFITYLGFKKQIVNLKTLIAYMVFGLTFYLFTSSTVHPWYIAMLLILSIFTRYKFPLIWSFTIMLSYSFYQNEAFKNNYWLLALEYLIVFGYLIYEIYKVKYQNNDKEIEI